MWIFIDAINYYTTAREFEQREIEYINPCLNLFAISDTNRNRTVATFLALRDGCSIEFAVPLQRVLANFATEHPKRIVKMS